VPTKRSIIGRGDSQTDKDQVANDEVPAGNGVALGDRHRGRGHHDHADCQQADGAEHQRAVELGRGSRLSPATGLFALDDGIHGYRTFIVARAASTSITAMIQKRTITFGSGQPLSSK
jgi:hypothetical protein